MWSFVFRKKNGFVCLDVRPSSDVETLNAREVDRGIYHADLPIKEIEEIWEERLPYLDFPFLNNTTRKIVLNISDLI